MNSIKLIADKLLATSALITGASEHELSLFVSRCQQAFQLTPPSDYIDFLTLCNGGAENGVFLYSTRRIQFADCEGQTNDFIEVNLNWRDLEWMKDYFVFGDSDMDIFVFEIFSERYQIRDRQVFDNVYAEYSSFNEMIKHVFEIMLQNSDT